MAPNPHPSIRESVARSLLARGATLRRGRRSVPDPSLFLMDEELVVQDAEGESVLRLPWFEEDLFLGRQLPDITEMPRNVRSSTVTHYRAALVGEAGRFTFVSYGHAYSVDAVPVQRDDGRITSVLGIATPVREFPSAAGAYERTAARLERSAANATQRADCHRALGRPTQEGAERERARRARLAAERARLQAQRLQTGSAPPDAPSVTPREADVLVLASHGLTSAEIAEQLDVSAGTVRTHLENVYLKLGVSDKAAAVATALRHGLID